MSREVGRVVRLQVQRSSLKVGDKPHVRYEKTLNGVFDQVIAWGGALKTVREGA